MPHKDTVIRPADPASYAKGQRPAGGNHAYSHIGHHSSTQVRAPAYVCSPTARDNPQVLTTTAKAKQAQDTMYHAWRDMHGTSMQAAWFPTLKHAFITTVPQIATHNSKGSLSCACSNLLPTHSCLYACHHSACHHSNAGPKANTSAVQHSRSALRPLSVRQHTETVVIQDACTPTTAKNTAPQNHLTATPQHPLAS